MTYNFETVKELGWAVLIGVAIFAFEVAVNFEPETIQDWQTWSLAALGGAVRAAGGAALAVLRGS